MMLKIILILVSALHNVLCVYPFYETQDFIYNIPKVYRIGMTVNKLLDHYINKPSKDPEWYIAVAASKSHLQFTIDNLDKSIPDKVKESLKEILHKLGTIHNTTSLDNLKYRNKDYEFYVNAIMSNSEIHTAVLEPLTIANIGAMKPYTWTLEEYTTNAETKNPVRKSADSCIMQLLIASAEAQNSAFEAACQYRKRCLSTMSEGDAYGFQLLTRARALQLSRTFECEPRVDKRAQLFTMCIQMNKEASSLEHWDHPPGTHTLFMSQVFLCSSEGYGEFIKPRWMNKIMSWQQPAGCYSDLRKGFERLTGFVGRDSEHRESKKANEKKMASSTSGTICDAQASGAALGSLIMYIRGLLDTDPGFENDFLK